MGKEAELLLQRAFALYRLWLRDAELEVGPQELVGDVMDDLEGSLVSSAGELAHIVAPELFLTKHPEGGIDGGTGKVLLCVLELQVSLVSCYVDHIEGVMVLKLIWSPEQKPDESLEIAKSHSNLHVVPDQLENQGLISS